MCSKKYFIADISLKLLYVRAVIDFAYPSHASAIVLYKLSYNGLIKILALKPVSPLPHNLFKIN